MKAPSIRIGWGVTLVLFLLGCLLALPARGADRVVAVTHFEVNADDGGLAPLGRGVADMLIGDLAGTDGLRLVERARLADILAELDLQHTHAIDPTTAQQLGRLLGAEEVVVGSLTASGDRMHLSARVLSVQTAEVLFAVEAEGKTDRFFAVEADLARALIHGFGKHVSEAQSRDLEEPETTSLAAVITYGKALEAYDNGDMATARTEARASMAADKAFKPARRILGESTERGRNYGELTFALGIAPVLSAKWRRLTATPDLHLGVGSWLTHTVGVGGQVGVLWKASRTALAPSPLSGEVSERLALIPMRGTGHLQLLEHRDLGINAWATAGIALGRHELLTIRSIVARRGVVAPILGGGVEIYHLRQKTQGIVYSLGWTFLPTHLSEGAGMLADGLVDLGGVELSVGYIYFGGMKR